MVNALIVGCGLLLAAPSEPSSPSSADLQAYQAAKAEAKRDPNAHIRLALWCEAHGMGTERLKHLAIAVLADPKNATARGLMGLVAYKGQWRRPEAVADKVQTDEERVASLAEYNERRERLGDTTDAHWKLALWCEKQGLKPEATAHFTVVVRLDPRNEAAWKRLGCKKHNGRWMTPEQISAEKAEAEAQRQANRHWKPLLEKWKAALAQDKGRDQAEAQLADLTDPRAVPALWQVFGHGTPAEQARAVQVLGQIDAPAASFGLAVLAVSGRTADVRRTANETLARRDPRDFVGFLVGLIRDPLKYQVKPVGGPGSPGILLVEGKQVNVRRVYAPPPLPDETMRFLNQQLAGVFIPENRREMTQLQGAILQSPGGIPDNIVGPDWIQQFTPDLNRVPVVPGAAPGAAPAVSNQVNPAGGGAVTSIAASDLAALQAGRSRNIANNLAEAQKSAVAAQQQLQNDVAYLENLNGGIRRTNERVLQALNTVTDQDLGENREAWAAWWTDQRGYAFQAVKTAPANKPTVDQLVALDYIPEYSRRHSCFGEGTPVRTLDGPRPIESLRVGDQVLAQDTQTGALGYQPVVAVHHNKPAATLRITLGAETIVATGIHRFWKAGKGWVMARDLKPGDAIRTLGGLAEVATVEAASVQPVFNLEVASGQSFFVGRQGALVHDNSLVRPELKPFDAPPTLAAAIDRTGGPAKAD